MVNAVTGQNLSLVSDVKGTTTDPVQKAMELLPLGPVVIIDTPGMDDEGELGEMRVHRARQVLARTDIAVLVVDAVRGLQPQDEALLKLFQERKVPYLIALNQMRPAAGASLRRGAPALRQRPAGRPHSRIEGSHCRRGAPAEK